MKVDISYNEDGSVISKIEIIPQDVWNVDVTAAHLITALLKSFINLDKGHTIPGALVPEDVYEHCVDDVERIEASKFFTEDQHWNITVATVWRRILNHMLAGFEKYSDFDLDASTRENNYQRRGRELFTKYFENLWD